MPLQHFFLGTEYLGKRKILPTCLVHEEHQPVWSVAYFCPHCGDIWARILIEPPGYHQVWARPCRQHMTSFWGGELAETRSVSFREQNIGHDRPADFRPDWPPAAVKYEFETLLERAEKGWL